MADPGTPVETAGSLRTVRAQLDGLEDHCETARHHLEGVRDALEDADDDGARKAVRRALDEEPRLTERCRAVRANTFDPLGRQLSKLVVTDPGSAADLSTERVDDAMGELGQHHDRLMAAVERLERLREDERFTAQKARQAIRDGVRATDHMESTVELLRCLLAKSDVEAESQGTGGTLAADEFVVRGTVTHGDGPLGDATVRAFDRDLGGEERLGETSTDESGHYRIIYRDADFEAAERETADVVVRAYNDVDTQIAESGPRYNVGRETTVDVRVPEDRDIEPSEHARLRCELQSLLQGQSVADLSDEDVGFLASELDLEQRTAFPAGKESMDALVAAAAYTSRTPFDESLLYGLARRDVGIDRTTLASDTAVELAEHLRAADRENIVDVRTDELEERLERGLDTIRRALELETGEEVQSTLAVVTTDGDPLSGVSVDVQDPDDERKRRTFVTGEDGSLTVSYMRSDGSEDASRRFRVTVRNGAGATLTEETVTVTPDETTELTVAEPGSGFSGTATVGSLRTDRDLDLPRFDGESTTTLGAVRRAGGVESLDGGIADSETRDSVNATASLDLLTDPETGNELARKGYTDQRSIADTPLPEFRSTMQGTLDPQRATAIHVTAQAQTYLLDSTIADRLAGIRNGTVPLDGSLSPEGGATDGE